MAELAERAAMNGSVLVGEVIVACQHGAPHQQWKKSQNANQAHPALEATLNCRQGQTLSFDCSDGQELILSCWPTFLVWTGVIRCRQLPLPTPRKIIHAF